MSKLNQVICNLYNEQVRWEVNENHSHFSTEHYEELIKKYYPEVQDDMSFEDFRDAVWNDFDIMMN